MPRVIAVRVGSLSSAPLDRAFGDSLGLLDAVDDALDSIRAIDDAMGLTDSASSNLVTSGVGLGQVTLGTAPLGT